MLPRVHAAFLTTLATIASSTAFAAPRPMPPAAREASAVSEPATAIVAGVCMKCHNAAMKAGSIDFTTREAAGKAFGAGDPAQSPLALAVSQGRMPPSGKLPEARIAILRRWVLAGAPYPRQGLDAAPVQRPQPWSLKPVRHPAVPHTALDRLACTPIDHFLFARLLQKGLRPSPAAGRLALIRRVSLDLTGLPPTPEEVDAFEHDRSPNAYEKAVDRLIASPAYGERWGRHWLDVVRYGESNGYEQNHLRASAWPYRDYVIRAFNDDKRYDRFVAEQLAGDALAATDHAAAAATGFLVAGIHDTVGIQTEEATRQQRANDLDDIVSTTGAAFLGLTVGCAHCHDHKFDPIPQRDYYRLSAVFAGVQHGERLVASSPGQLRELKEAEQIARQIAADTNEINALDAGARETLLRARGQSAVLRPAVNARRNVDEFPPAVARFVRFTILGTSDGAEPCLDELQVFGDDETRNLALSALGARATASSLLPGFSMHQVEHLNDGKPGNDFSWISNERGAGWAQVELPAATRIHRVVWSRDGGEIPRFDDRLTVAYRIELSMDGKSWQTVSTQAGRASYNGYIHPDELMAVMTPVQRDRRKFVSADLDVLHQRASQIEADTSAYVGQFTSPGPTFLLRRGDVMQRIDPVAPGALSQVPGLSADLLLDATAPEPARRLALARWITDPRNPLTARVMVNRIWQGHFGRGLVGTSSDFGNNGEKPSHPELLDWLASDFMAHGWHIKRLQKLIVMSYAYRQSSDGNDRGLAVDAGDEYLWRMPLRRMEAEAVRDSILAVSGKLDRRMGGPGFRLFRYSVVNVAIYEPLDEYGPDTWRRSVYQQSARGIQDGLLGRFDCPECSQREPRRASTTTSLQALALLDSTFVVQQAGFFAGRVEKEAGPLAGAQVDCAFRLAFGRLPGAFERQMSLSLLTRLGLPALCRALFNTNEFLYY